MRRLIAAAGVTGVLLLGGLGGLGASAGAGPNENAPHSGGTGSGEHPHHVHKGNGECHDIDQRRFEPGDRGMHRAANESGPGHGPYHGTCASHTHP